MFIAFSFRGFGTHSLASPLYYPFTRRKRAGFFDYFSACLSAILTTHGNALASLLICVCMACLLIPDARSAIRFCVSPLASPLTISSCCADNLPISAIILCAGDSSHPPCRPLKAAAGTPESRAADRASLLSHAALNPSQRSASIDRIAAASILSIAENILASGDPALSRDIIRPRYDDESVIPPSVTMLCPSVWNSGFGPSHPAQQTGSPSPFIGHDVQDLCVAPPTPRRFPAPSVQLTGPVHLSHIGDPDPASGQCARTHRSAFGGILEPRFLALRLGISDARAFVFGYADSDPAATPRPDPPDGNARDVPRVRPEPGNRQRIDDCACGVVQAPRAY